VKAAASAASQRGKPSRVLAGLSWAPRHRAETDQPATRDPFTPARRRVGYAVAIVAPALTAVVLVPFRDTFTHSAALIMLCPVLAVAAFAGLRASVVAAGVAALSFDFMLTEPYYHLVIDDADDIAAAVTLLATGLAAGVLVTQARKLSVRASTRRLELHHLETFAIETITTHDTADLIDHARQHLIDLLHLGECRWDEHYQGGRGPTMAVAGGITAFLSDLPADRSRLPEQLEIPVRVGGRTYGTFLTSTPGDRSISREERRAASVLVLLLGHELERRERDSPS
jgi:hypothetical protein